MNSDWSVTKQRSQYHFDNNIMDPRWDTVQHLGNIKADCKFCCTRLKILVFI